MSALVPMTTPPPTAMLVNSDDDGAWNVVHRRAKDQGHRSIASQITSVNAYKVLSEVEQGNQDNNGDKDGREGDNPQPTQ